MVLHSSRGSRRLHGHPAPLDPPGIPEPPPLSPSQRPGTERAGTTCGLARTSAWTTRGPPKKAKPKTVRGTTGGTQTLAASDSIKGLWFWFSGVMMHWGLGLGKRSLSELRIKAVEEMIRCPGFASKQSGQAGSRLGLRVM